jgi:SAM-dependent methyltransferase
MGNSTLHRPPAYLNQLLRRLLAVPAGGHEISDAIVDFDPDTLARRPVNKQSVINDFMSLQSSTAAAIVESITADSAGMLDATAVDRLLVSVHCEMQRLSEELQHGRRVAQVLNPILRSIPQSDSADTRRVVDVGCGSGYVIRWLAAHKAVPDNVELIGADYHSALINEARRLAELEKLRCRFVVANAFALKQPATVYLSTGILHHFRGSGLVELFKLHQGDETKAFIHFDFHPSALAPFGSWLFHIVRMRAALARYDGVLSAVRAYRAEELLAAARSGAPDFVSAIYGTKLWGLPIPRAFHCLVGIRPRYRNAFIAQMNGKLASLGVLE